MYSLGYANNTDTFVAGFIFLMISLLIISFIIYVFEAISLSAVAKAENYPNPYYAWFAWLPIFKYYLLIKLAGGNPNILWLFIVSLLPVIGPSATFLLVVYIAVMIFRLSTKYGANKILVIIGCFIPIVLCIPYFQMYKNARKKIKES